MIKSAVKKADDDLANTETKAEETSSQKLFNHLFEACNILRGPTNQDEYKSYVTPILFFKRISHVYDERLKNLVEHMSKIKVGNKNYSADVMGDAYEYLIKIR